MQSPPGQTLQPVMLKWYTTRTVISGVWLGALAVLYFILVYPVAIAEVPPSDYRFTFFFIAAIYAVDLGILSIEWLYKVVRPPKAIPPAMAMGKLGVLGMGLRTAFVVSVGGSYITGAAVATPTVFSSLQFLAGGGTVPILADYLHSVFAALIVAFGVVIVVYELAKIGVHKSTIKDWLVRARYPEVKLFYWMFAIAVVVQGFVGIFLLGTISPLGPYPFPFVGNLAYSLETLLRHIHGPLGAVTFALFTNLIYFRLRPEFKLR
jgi:hypothetical protein